MKTTTNQLALKTDLIQINPDKDLVAIPASAHHRDAVMTARDHPQNAAMSAIAPRLDDAMIEIDLHHEDDHHRQPDLLDHFDPFMLISAMERRGSSFIV